MTVLFAPLINGNESLIYIDDRLGPAEKTHQMFERFQKFQEAVRNSNPETASDRMFSFLIAVKCLGHTITQNKNLRLDIENEVIEQMMDPE